MNEELTIAIDELSQRPLIEYGLFLLSWIYAISLIRDIGGGETLNDIQHVKLYEDWENSIQRVVKIIQPESPEKTLDENRISVEIDQRAIAEYNKGLACQEEIGLANSPEKQEQKIQQTLDHYLKALKIQPDYVDAINARGGIYTLMNNYKDALKILQKY